MQCVYPDCPNTSRTRGLCHGHYQIMRDRVRKGRANEGDLEQRGLLTKKGTGGTSVNGHAAFECGSKVLGDAHESRLVPEDPAGCESLGK